MKRCQTEIRGTRKAWGCENIAEYRESYCDYCNRGILPPRPTRVKQRVSKRQRAQRNTKNIQAYGSSLRSSYPLELLKSVGPTPDMVR